MPEEIDFTDLSILTSIKQDTVVEKFSSVINASFFDASNILGTLKQKNLIDFSIQFPGQNKVEVTEYGKQLIAEADAKAAEQQLDSLDTGLLDAIASGKRSVAELDESLNVRHKDTAMRLYKLYKQQYLNYDFKNGQVALVLTEKGFTQARSNPAPQQRAGTQADAAGGGDLAGSGAQQPEQHDAAYAGAAIAKRRIVAAFVAAIVAVVAIIAIILVVLKLKLPPI